MSIGAAAENAKIALHACGFIVTILVKDQQIYITWKASKLTINSAPLEALKNRRTNRFKFSDIGDQAILEELGNIRLIGQAKVIISQDPTLIKMLADYSSRSIDMAINQTLLAKELSNLLVPSFTRQQYGIPAKSLGYTTIGLYRQKLRLNLGFASKSEKLREHRMLRKAPAVACIFNAGDVIEHWIESGRMYESFATALTQKGLSYSTHAACVEAPDFHKEIARYLKVKMRLHCLLRLGMSNKKLAPTARIG